MKTVHLITIIILFSCITSYAQNIAINDDGSVPDSSAQLDVKSTTRGFLMPRMTYAQRDSIHSPKAGLVVWCSNCGLSGELQVFNGNIWTNMVGGTASGVPTIGDSYKGGTIAYILQNGDPGYDSTVRHGLIASVTDVSNGTTWYNGNYIITHASGVALGTGNANSDSIINIQGGGNYAAKLCADLSVISGGTTYSDWYLPSKDELNKLYINRIAIVGFAEANYWSSTEQVFPDQDIYAWFQSFTDGTQSYEYKDHTFYVRAVRKF